MHVQHVGLEVGRLAGHLAADVALAEAEVDLAVVAERVPLAVGAATHLAPVPFARRTYGDTKTARHWRPQQQAQLLTAGTR